MIVVYYGLRQKEGFCRNRTTTICSASLGIEWQLPRRVWILNREPIWKSEPCDAGRAKEATMKEGEAGEEQSFQTCRAA